MKLLSMAYSCDIELEPLADRWYDIPEHFSILLITDRGMYTVYLDPHFDFDGRSGGAAVDYIAPNLGTQAETKSWLLHDIMYYDVGFTFSEANDFLLTNLRKNCGYGWFKAHTIWAAVQLFGKSSFGTPKIADREYPNIARIHVSKPESRK